MARSLREENVGKLVHGRITKAIEWEIKNYFEISPEASSLMSPDIDFLGATWCLSLFAKGQITFPFKDSTSQFLGLVGLTVKRKKSYIDEHYLNFTYGVKRNDGSIVRCWSDTFEFGHDKPGKAFTVRLPTAFIEDKEKIAIDTTLTLFCSMSANSLQAIVQRDSRTALQTLAQNFRNLMANEEASDVILNVKNRKFRVHSAVLVARSSVFAAMMKHDMKEKRSGVVDITDCDPDAFQVYLEYMYTGDIEKISTDTMFELYYIADKYDTEELKTACIQFMKGSLSVEIFFDVLALALNYNESQLRKVTVMFLGRHLKEILVTLKWLSFVKENPVQANDLYVKALDYYEKSQ